ncbi:SEC14-like protein 2 [Orchesella cincta]|uniref:SEC14-like protein 2 n=1 Tax=Orchesella cincta TaxID=48709 RepID=A0A1D2MAZ2_ORCCI|nr:SEC14-like protein 2 [Orchesella cincta]
MSQTNHLSSIFLSVVVLLFVESNVSVSAISVEKYLTLTLSQKTALDEFRHRVEPMLKDNYMKQDAYLIQWLRGARKFDINAATEMLRMNLKWRKENAIDNMRNEDWTDMLQDFHTTIDTYDRTGRPIAVIDINDWDIRRSVIQGKGKRVMRYIMSRVENITGQAYERQEKGMNVTQVVVLANAEGFNVIQHACPLCLPLWIQFIQYIESYYPEALDELIIINAPPTIQVVLEAIKPFLTKTTSDGIRIFNPNKAKWMEYLDAKMSREERRKPYGGTKPPFDFSR